MIERLALTALRAVDPERAHGLALRALPLASLPGPVESPRLVTRLAGIDMPNPIGLAAGFDKNATAMSHLMQAGFGFLEVGAATPKPQPGNPRPRLFRLVRDRAAINRFGFNNDGVDAIADRLANRPDGIPVALNIGANKDSADRAADFAHVMKVTRTLVDFATVNVSSPNTEKLRDLQGPAALKALLDGVLSESGKTPVFLKIAPDLTETEIAEIAGVALESGVAGIIATNTTLARDGLVSRRRGEQGGLSGRPLFVPSTRVLARLYKETGGELPLIGVGGVSSAADAYAKIKAGASAVQLYTAMVFHGLSLAHRLARGVDEMLSHDGFANVSDAVGTDVEHWL
ncbi:MAG: quinone-dependent dihydroorotate dehydrogenase [Pseudomonadota bacterium]